MLISHTNKDRAGGEVATVDPHSLAWRAGLQPGDAITSITFPNGDRFAITTGEMAFEILRQAHGRLTLGIQRRRWTAEDRAAVALQSAWIGAVVRRSLSHPRPLAEKQLLMMPKLDRQHSGRKRLIREPPRLSARSEDDEDDQ